MLVEDLERIPERPATQVELVAQLPGGPGGLLRARGTCGRGWRGLAGGSAVLVDRTP